MEPKDLKTLLLMEAIDNKECQSQRELSRKLNISLGLVNTFIKNLTIRGIFKTTKLTNNRIRYVLSPKGMVAKADLTKQYLSYSIQCYNEIKKRIAQVIANLGKDGRKYIVFYGATELCEIASMTIGADNAMNLKIIDDGKAGSRMCGIEISEEATLDNLHFDALVIMDLENISIIRSRLVDKGVPDEKIYELIFH